MSDYNMKASLKSNPIKRFRSFIYRVNQFNIHSKRINNNIEIGCDKKYGKYIHIDGVMIAIDRWNPKADVIYVSHAHMDHIPVIPENILKNLEDHQNPVKFACSKITKEITEARTRGKFTFPESLWLIGKEMNQSQSIEYNGVSLTLIENGHAYGSTSLLIEGSEKILYTNDFITEDREFLNGNKTIKGLKPIECKRLIVECTFGSPNYIFPSFKEIQVELNNYIENEISEGHLVILLGYAYGKSQIILNIINTTHKIILERNIAQIVKILEKNGIVFPEWEPYGNYKKNKLKQLSDYILIIPPYSVFSEPYKSLIAEGAKVVYLSGKVLNELSRREFPSDKCIPFSDHCDFNSLKKFVENCKPEKIYLEHGKIEEFSYFISKIYKKEKIFSIY